MRFLSFLGLPDRNGLRERLSSAIKQIELHWRELENARKMLESRRDSLHESVVRSLNSRDDDKANVYSLEHEEISKVLRVVKVSEMALMQITIRLESIRDTGDIVEHMSSAFKVMKKVSKNVSGLVPTLESVTSDVNSALSETMAELSNIAPTIMIDAQSETGQEIVGKALRYAEEKNTETGEPLPASIMSARGQTFVEKAHNVALLATGDDVSEDEFAPSLLRGKRESTEMSIHKYIVDHGGRLDVLDAAVKLNVPVEEVERTALRLASSDLIRLSGESDIC